MYFTKRHLNIFIIFHVLLVAKSFRYKKRSKNEITSDLIKNVSIANKILQQLINNYPGVENGHVSSELTKSGSSESDVDKLIKLLTSDVDDEKLNRASQYTTTKSINDRDFVQTAMIYENYKNPEKTTPETDTSADENNATTNTSNIHIKTLRYENNGSDDDSGTESQDTQELTINIVETTTIRDKSKHDDSNEESTSTIGNNTRRVAKIIYIETFPKENIWHDIVRRPLKFNLNKDVEKQVDKSAGINSLIPGENRASIEKQVDDIDEKTLFSRESDIIEPNSLREKYGEACVVVAVRKCYKALKNVIKNVCSERKCKKHFKTTFIQKSKSGCIDQFDYKKTEEPERVDPITSTKATEQKSDCSSTERCVKQRSQDANTINSNQKPGDIFKDITRVKYLDACMPSYIMESEAAARIGPQTMKYYNILRDKYEDRCKKLSSEKCVYACHYAYNETCSEHDCEKKKIKAFERSCDRNCKAQYNVAKKESSEDVSSNSSSGKSSGNDGSLTTDEISE